MRWCFLDLELVVTNCIVAWFEICREHLYRAEAVCSKNLGVGLVNAQFKGRSLAASHRLKSLGLCRVWVATNCSFEQDMS